MSMYITDWQALAKAVGSLVIVGDFDAPEAAMIAVVTQTGCNGNLRVRYISKRASRGEFAHPFEADPKSLTPVDDFSVRISFKDGYIVPMPLRGISRAKYSDGKPRSWQGGRREAELATWAKKQKRFSTVRRVASC